MLDWSAVLMRPHGHAAHHATFRDRKYGIYLSAEGTYVNGIHLRHHPAQKPLTNLTARAIMAINNLSTGQDYEATLPSDLAIVHAFEWMRDSFRR